jgi:hypothetical protein
MKNKSPKTNWRKESLGFRLRIQSGFVRVGDLQICIFKDSFRAIVLKFRWIHEKKSNLLKMAGFMVHDLKGIFSIQDL